jgi:ribosome-associated toxin RatA of RatAB toxin-antitoxin module
LAHSIKRSALVTFSAQQMFALVNDIEAYPEYMDGCSGAKILSREGDWLEARLDLSKGGITQSFITRNHLQAPEKMSITLVDGPFKRLEGCWQFTPLAADACKVSFELEFELQHKLLGLAVGKLFEHAASKQVECLCERAKQIYGIKLEQHK